MGRIKSIGGDVVGEIKGIKVYVGQERLVHCGMLQVEPFPPALMCGFGRVR